VEQALREALPSGGVIRETDLERGLLLLNDLPGIAVRSVISPGAALGTSTITAEVSEGPLVTGSIDTDTHGNKYSGYYQLGATLNLNDPTGHGDLFTARIAATSGTSYGRLAYQIPLGASGLRLGGVYSETRYELCCDFDALEAEGNAHTATLVLQYPFVRSRDYSLYGSLAYDARSYFDETIAGTTDDKKTRLFTLGINGDGRDFLYGGGLNNFWLAATSGRLDLDDWAPYKAADAASARTQGSYGKLSYSLSRLQNLVASTSLYAGLAGQFASKNLDSSEKFVLGGATGLRGYPSGEAAGDEGLLVNMELRHNFLDSLQLTGFVEHGEIRLHKNPWAGWQGANTRISNRYGLSDFGLALNWHQPGRLVVRASAARPMGSNPGRSLDGKDSDGRKSGTHFWLQMVKFL
jgi:hemolysin activation/secretion protein